MLVVEDSLIVREGIVSVLTGLRHSVVATAGRAEQVLGLAARHRPDLVVMDIRMPPTFTDEGIRLSATLRQRRPGAPVLILSQYADAAHASSLLTSDPRGLGYLLKERLIDAEMLDAAVDRVTSGGTMIDPSLVADLIGRPRRESLLATLTARERDVLALMAEGCSDRGIADRLSVSVTTVGSHVQAVFRKLDLPDSVQDNRRVHAVLTYLRHR